MDDEKQIRWVGSAYDDLLAFPKDARKEAGFQLGKEAVRRCGCRYKRDSHPGRERDLSLCDVSREVRGRHLRAALLQKKTQATSKQDKAIAAARYRAVVNARREKK